MDLPAPPRAPGVDVEVSTWRPVVQVDLDGWHLGFSRGFTRRANSVVPRAAPRDLAGTLDRVEAMYADHRLPTVLRVCQAARPAGLDSFLADRGYARRAPTAVMVRAVATGPEPAEDPGGVTVRVAEVPTRTWVECWLEVKTATAGGVDPDTAEQVLRGSPAVYLTAEDADGPAAVARVAFAGTWAGLSCLTVRTRARRQGLGALLTRVGLEHAAERGATDAFLQVEESNAAAVRLYEGAGFVVADRYHYRQR